MTISSTTRLAGPFAGNGANTVFSFNFKVFQPADVLVVQTDNAGNNTSLTLTSQYSVALNGNQDTTPGGSVTLVTAPPTGYSVTLSSQVAALQGTNLANAGNFYPASVTNALDLLTILIQQLGLQVSNALQLPINVSGVSVALPSPVASAILGWNNAGTGLVNYAGLAGSPVSSAMQPILSSATLAAALTSLGVSTVMQPVVGAASLAAARAALGAQATLGYTAANDANVVHLTGNESIAGTKTFGSAPVFASAPAVTAAQSMVRVGTSNGNGSTNTAIRRYTTVLTNQGSDITYTDSATLGGLFTINTAGVYAITVRANSAASLEFGISLNSSQLSTSVSSVNSVDCLDYINGNNITLACGWTGYLPAGSLIRSHDSAGGGHSVFVPAAEQFTITRVS